MSKINGYVFRMNGFRTNGFRTPFILGLRVNHLSGKCLKHRASFKNISSQKSLYHEQIDRNYHPILL